eukprot:CAMPEP_0184532660 /NCGR_PEP_ID=MMETSP0198_2-20121128/14293_1 /TAXON_ID=1112570 /ORGANISM="Thraustochytrium sp., Strain LLF1b" /LENGTH=39 /DNA_ID= /DNA_START= /DNA_END= /DNA_ORIENTATION=
MAALRSIFPKTTNRPSSTQILEPIASANAMRGTVSSSTT